MSFLSILRDVTYIARDILPALKRFTSPQPDDSPDAYAEHLAKVRADVLAEREAQEEVLEPGEAQECLCDEDGCVCWPGSEQRLIGPRNELLGPYESPEYFGPPTSADEPAFTQWLASIDARLTAIESQLTSAAPVTVPTDDARERPEEAPRLPASSGHLILSRDDVVDAEVALRLYAKGCGSLAAVKYWNELADRFAATAGITTRT